MRLVIHTSDTTLSEDIYVTFTPNPTSCGEDNGSLFATINYSNGAVSYTVDGISVSLPIVQLSAGDYTVVATDDVGCSCTEVVTIEDSDDQSK